MRNCARNRPDCSQRARMRTSNRSGRSDVRAPVPAGSDADARLVNYFLAGAAGAGGKMGFTTGGGVIIDEPGADVAAGAGAAAAAATLAGFFVLPFAQPGVPVQ